MDSLLWTRNLQGKGLRGMVRKFCLLSLWGLLFSASFRCTLAFMSGPWLWQCTPIMLVEFSCNFIGRVILQFNREGLHQFWTWLELVGNESGRSLLIAAHNGSGFDFPILLVLLPLLSMLLFSLSLLSSSTFSLLLLGSYFNSFLCHDFLHDCRQTWQIMASQCPPVLLAKFGELTPAKPSGSRKSILKCHSICSFLRKLFAEQGEPEQSCKLETLLQKFHPLWREKQVEKVQFELSTWLIVAGTWWAEGCPWLKRSDRLGGSRHEPKTWRSYFQGRAAPKLVSWGHWSPLAGRKLMFARLENLSENTRSKMLW